MNADLADLQALAISAGLAALIGLERELAHRPAGLRTHILVGVAATLLMQLATFMAADFAEELGPSMISVDPIRILQAIIVGISFLGAGTIVQGQGGHVEGLTTAASILLTAAIGVAVALDRIFLASALSVGIALTLYVLGKIVPSSESVPSSGTDASVLPPQPRIQAARRRAPPGAD